MPVERRQRSQRAQMVPRSRRGSVDLGSDGATLYSVGAEDGVLAWSLGRGRPGPEAFEVPECPS